MLDRGPLFGGYGGVDKLRRRGVGRKGGARVPIWGAASGGREGRPKLTTRRGSGIFKKSEGLAWGEENSNDWGGLGRDPERRKAIF